MCVCCVCVCVCVCLCVVCVHKSARVWMSVLNTYIISYTHRGIYIHKNMYRAKPLWFAGKSIPKLRCGYDQACDA